MIYLSDFLVERCDDTSPVTDRLTQLEYALKSFQCTIGLVQGIQILSACGLPTPKGFCMIARRVFTLSNDRWSFNWWLEVFVHFELWVSNSVLEIGLETKVIIPPKILTETGSVCRVAKNGCDGAPTVALQQVVRDCFEVS